ncbi:MAG TPA: histidine kinase N-terminal 7TM domain-containing protein [Flexilinea sp.]|nr:histidine kinase N-terminal 7TM domain-containing protein [Flexilinea sp.]HPJ65935.1 histidine kinase N-terminal 7TM domain-containing protein [Flexilinea sp.]HPR69956.1 histidine kinase N-terminal 7TM domain-containing protein [Flexilinea sp.]
MINWILPIIRTISEILTASIAIASFSLLLFSLFFIQKERLARVFSLILLALSVIYTADALSLTTLSDQNQLLWQQIHWSGIIFLPATMIHFSQVILQMTGKTIRKLRKKMTAVTYIFSVIFLVLLWKNQLFYGTRRVGNLGISMIPTEKLNYFWIWLFVLLGAMLINFYHAFKRTRTPTSRRRMLYLIVSALGVLVGTFPLMIYGSGFLLRHELGFWLVNLIANILILLMVLLLGYSVITFCVSWSYRVVRLRLMEWILRGPVTAGLTLGLVTIIRRSSGTLNINVGGWTSLLMVVSIVVLEYLITLLMPLFERNSISGYGNQDYQIVSGLENMMIFSSELETYLESIISALCDIYQAKGVFVAVTDSMGNVENLIHVGETSLSDPIIFSEKIEALQGFTDEPITDDGSILLPVFYRDLTENKTWLLAIIGITDPAVTGEESEPQSALKVAADKIRIVLWQRWYLGRTFNVLRELSNDEKLGSYRKIGLLNTAEVLDQKSDYELEEVSTWVRDALTHYWGGPRLTENPLIRLDIVQQEMNGDSNNATNALRTILKKAIDQIRPSGERSISGEWTLYNILDLKFIEGLKVKEVAKKLAMSEADLYRKQRVAIEELAKTIIRMEKEHNSSHL